VSSFVFSSRLPDTLLPNAMSRAVVDLHRSGAPLIDLTETNPTVVGLPYPQDLLSCLDDPHARVYRPHPRGLPEARDAVAADYLRRGAAIPADCITLTASTSEAYGILFKLLCNSGDHVLVPQPSYPLFELLTRLEGVEARPYQLDRFGAWSIDRESLERARTARTRAMLVVSPNNPTGSMISGSDRDWMTAWCASHGMACIADEVFADYPLAPRRDAVTMTRQSAALTFSLGGLSKSVGLPQLKLGWIAVSGPDAAREAALERLDIINDSYLSASTPVQIAAPRLLQSGIAVRRAIADRIADNLARLREAVAAHPSVTLLEPEGGWSAVLEVPATQSEESLVLRLLHDAHVIVHPGYFFDFPTEAFLVVSLLPEPGLFAQALERLLPVCAGVVA
jgi:alanine-synthesizing transaminase